MESEWAGGSGLLRVTAGDRLVIASVHVHEIINDGSVRNQGFYC